MSLRILRRTLASRVPLQNHDLVHPIAGGSFAPYAALRIRTSTRHIHTLEQCPPPTCTCRETPQGFEIDHEKPLAGTMPSYAEHVVVSTGKSDWPSKIEDDETTPVVRELKQRLGRDGKFSNPFHNVNITTSSHTNPSSATRLLLFPSFISVNLPDASATSDASAQLDNLIKAFILPTTVRTPDIVQLPPSAITNLTRDPSQQRAFESSPITTPVVLICGHGGRDARCGAFGPLLEDEFRDKLGAAGLGNASIAQISHIGGHRFAGNVIIYLPPNMSTPLAGCGVWYGRVEPRHVEGIVDATIAHGQVIKELFRGGVHANGSMMRL